jgi:hypothetical protein
MSDTATLRAVITARDEASRAFKSTSASLQKLGVDAKKANEMTRQAWSQGANLKGIQGAEASLKRLGLTSTQAQAALTKAGVSVSLLSKQAAVATPSLAKIGTGLQSAASAASRFALGAGVAIGAAAAYVVKLGMDSVETANLFTVSMGTMGAAGTQWIDRMNAAYGLNKVALQQQLGMFNQWFNSMGMGTERAYGMSTALTQLAYDFSSFYNVAPEEAFQKIQSAMSGEMEAVRRWGIDVSDAAVQSYALTRGLAKQGDTLNQQQKAWIRYALLMEQSANAQGDLARTITSPANQFRLLQERVKSLATEIGQGLLPTVANALMWMNNEGLPRVRAGVFAFRDSWVEMGDIAKLRIFAIAALLVAGGPMLKALSVLVTGMGLVKTAFWELAQAGVQSFKTVAKGVMALATTIPGKIAIVAGSVLTIFDIMSKASAEGVSAALGELGKALNGVGVAMAGLPGAAGAIGRAMANAGAEAKETAGWLQGRGFSNNEWWFTRLADAAKPALGEIEKPFDDLLGQAKAFGTVVPNSFSDAGTAAKEFALSGGNAFDAVAHNILGLGADAIAGWAAAFDKAVGYAGSIKNDYNDVGVKVKEVQNTIGDLKGPPPMTKEEFANLGEALADAKDKADKAGISVSDLTQALVANSGITKAAAAAVTYWEGRIESTNLAIQANRDQLQAAQADLQGMQDHLSDLNDELSTAKQRFDAFTKPTLTGMGKFDDQIFAAEQAIKRLQLSELDWQMSGGKGDSPFADQIQAAQNELQRLQLTQSLTYDQSLRDLQKLADGPQTEYSFAQARAGLLDAKGQVASLTEAIAAQELQIESQQGVIKSIQEAGDALNRTLAEQQAQLELARQNYDNVTKSLQDALTWYLKDREEIEKLGPAGVAAAAQIDEATKTLLTGLSAFAETNTATNQTVVAQMVADYEGAVNNIKAMIASIPAVAAPAYSPTTGQGGFVAVVNGQVVSKPGATQTEAENAYNAAGGPPNMDGSNNVARRASGGPVLAGQMYLVGERGPEPFIPATNGTILPHSSLGGLTVVINVNGGTHLGSSTETARELARIIEPEIRRQVVMGR